MGKKKDIVVPDKISSFEDFMLMVESISSLYVNKGDPQARESYRYGRQPKEKKDETPHIYVEWTTGGIGGGSCWDTSENESHYSTGGEAPRELEDLDKILEKVSPQITFLQYKNLCSEVVEFYERTQNEYYGNCTNYAAKKCNLRKLYDALVKRGML